MRKNNFQKNVLLIALLVLCLATASCDQAANPSVTDGSTADTSHTEITDSLPTETETTEISAVTEITADFPQAEIDTEHITDDTKPPLKEFDLNGYMDLNQSSDSDRLYSYLRKSDIMAFDPTADYLEMTDVAYWPAFSFHYAIRSEEKTLFGLPGYIFYAGGSDMEELASNVVAGTEPTMYDEYYVYVGNGDDLKYDYLYFTAINLSLDDYAHVLTSIADMANIDASSIELILANESGYSDWGNPTHLNELAQRLGIHDTAAIVDQVTLSVDADSPDSPIIVQNGDDQWKITIYWRYWEKFMLNYTTFKNTCSWDEQVVNKIEIYISCLNT